MKKVYLLLKIMAVNILLPGLAFQSYSQSPNPYPGTALVFNGNSEYVKIWSSSSLNLTTNYTIEAWIKPESFSSQDGIVSKYNYPSSNGYYIWLHPDAPYTGLTFDGMNTSTGILEIDTWYHIAAINDNGTRKLYLNGVEQTLTGTSLTVLVNSDFLCIGSSYFSYMPPFGNNFDGKIEEVRIWNTVLDSVQIRENMYLPLDGTETGLISYWQFNDGTGTTLSDVVGGNNGTLMYMQEEDWITSTIPFGSGQSNTQTETAGTVDFTGTGLSMDFNAQSGAEITVTRIDTVPNINPTSADTVFDSQYWVVNRYGSGSFDADLTFTLNEDLTSEDESSLIGLFTRTSTSDMSWAYLRSASSVDTLNDKATFDGITDFSQFIIMKMLDLDISLDTDTLDFGPVLCGDSLSLTVNIANTGTDTLLISDISTSHSYFSVDTNNLVITPDTSFNLTVTFSPASNIELTETLTITSNDPDEPEAEVILMGNNRKIVLLESLDFTLITANFNSIDVGGYSAPSFTDIDGDDLLDLIIGEFDGNLNHYEQDVADSTSFSLITQNFSSINLNAQSTPNFTDFDGDGLLDLIIGQLDFKLNHYEQDAINSGSFSLITTNFNSIDVGYDFAPSFTDLDGDGLLDMVIGEKEGNLNHYEQDAVNSTSFTLVTENFNSIDVGLCSKPNFTDLDGDGLLDLIIGEHDGNLNHYEQDTVNSTSFSLVTANFNSIDEGYYSAPSFTDLDGDGLLDLIIGENDGNLNHYEQEGIDTLCFGNVLAGNTALKNYYLKAGNLGSDLNIECPEGYKVSLSDSAGFVQNLSITPVNHRVFDTVYIRFEPDSLKEYSGNIVNSSNGAETKNISVSGNGIGSTDTFPGTALDFDGTDDYVDCGYGPQITGNNPRTIEAWAYAEGFNNGGIFQAGATGSAGHDFSFRTRDTDNLWRAQFWGSADFDVNLLDSKNNWHHYCLTYDGTTAKLYYDGELAGSKDVSLDTEANDVYFGNWGNNYFDGKIEEVRIWNIALDSVQIRENMYLPLDGTETGLIGYWQFNDGTGTTLSDVVGGNSGTLTNMDENDWIASTIPFGAGQSNTQTETAGIVDYTGTGLSMDFNTQSGAEITVTRIDTIPNINPTGADTVFGSQYWVVNRYGSGNFDADLTFALNEDLTSEDESSLIGLYTRTSTSDMNWAYLRSASSVDTLNDKATFDGITDFSQFIIIKMFDRDISLDTDTLDFGPVLCGDSLSLTVNIANAGTDTLLISDISTSHYYFSVDTNNLVIPPDTNFNLTVTFTPASKIELIRTLTITSNDPDEPEVEVLLIGKGTDIPEIVLLKSPDFTLITANFNSIDVGNHSTPSFNDLDADSLLDMVIGENDGNLNHYEQDAVNSTSFSFITGNISSIDVGTNSAPTFTDLDGDGLLDLIIGEWDGNLNHYEQDIVNSTSFSLVAGNFSSIYVGVLSMPSFTDLDGNGLLDLIIGEWDGNLNHYEQDAVNSTSFSFITGNFNSIDVGNRSAPTFTDLDSDGLLDLIIGELDGTLNYYEQDTINSTLFSLVTENFNSIDVGDRSAPAFTDFDGDGLLDMVIGEEYDNLNHYEQEGIDTLSFGNVWAGNTVLENYYIKAGDITSDLDIGCPEGYKVSLSDSTGFVQSLSISPVNNRVNDTIYLRFEPDSLKEYNGNIVHSSNGAETKNIIVSGTGASTDAFPGTALDFDGTDDYVEVQDISALDLTNSLTIEAWIKAASWKTNVWDENIVSKQGDVSGYMLRCGDNGKLDFTIGTGVWSVLRTDEPDSLSLNTWYHIAATYNGAAQKIYINGMLIKEGATSGDILANANSLMIGTSPGDLIRTFSGKIEEVRIWNTARDSVQIRENMYLLLDGTETGLISYWQFNDGTGTTLSDIVGRNHGTLTNMDENDWITSTIPFGAGQSNTQTETTGTVNFTGTGLSMDFNAQSGAEITVTRIDTVPNINPTYADTVFDSQYWVVNRFGSGNFDADLTFALKEDLTSEDESSLIGLYTRTSTSDMNWAYLRSASSVDTLNDKATFDGITDFSQFIIMKMLDLDISLDTDTLDFGSVLGWDSLSLTVNIANAGTDTLLISDIFTSHYYFSVDTNNLVIPPNTNFNLTVTFTPTSNVELTETLTITSNDPDEPEVEVILIGKGIVAEIVLLKSPEVFTLISANFNSIDVGIYSAPSFTDIDSDSLLDLIIGKYNGTLNQYEQDAVNSTSFSFITTNFSSIDVELYSAPAFTDIDNDGLLDLIIGEVDGNLNHYEQDAVDPGSFLLVTNNFNSIDVGNNSTPSFTDLDGDSLLDLVIGANDGTLDHYEQNAVNSGSFSLITGNFNFINVGNYSAPSFTDIDGDGLLDLIIGEYDGNLNQYEQDAVNSTSFSLITGNFSSIDLGSYSRLKPSFIDLGGDGLLDLIIGEVDGNLNHYQQEGIDTLSFGNVLEGNIAHKNYYLKAGDLLGNLNIECPEGYKVSLSESAGFVQSLSISPVNQRVSDTIYLRFEPDSLKEYSGNIVHSSNGAETKNIAVSGTGVLADAFPGTALDFDGTNDYVEVSWSASLNPNQFTIECWVMVEGGQGSWRSPVTSRDTDPWRGYLVYAGYDDKWQFWTGTGGTLANKIIGNGNVAVDTWTHIAGTYDGSEMKLYINGNSDGTLSSVTFAVNDSQPLRIGAGKTEAAADYHFPGKIDEVRIWNIALDSVQIRENMYQTLTGLEAGLVTYWQFNDGTGTTLLDIVGGHSGTLTNMDENDWVTSTAPLPFVTAGDGMWESNSTWATGQNTPTHPWSRARIEHNITINSTFEVIELKVDTSGTITITTGYQVTVSGE